LIPASGNFLFIGNANSLLQNSKSQCFCILANALLSTSSGNQDYWLNSAQKIKLVTG